MPTAPLGVPGLLAARIFEQARSCPEATYLEDRAGGRVTYGDLDAARLEMSRRLDSLGVRQGARVVLCCPDLLDYAVKFVALLASDRVVVPVDPRAPTEELAKLRMSTSPVALVGGGGSVTLFEGDNRPRNAGVRSGGVFLCTSGTTGAAKGVLLSESQVVHVAKTVASHHGIVPGERGLCLLPLFHVNAEVVGLIATLFGGGELVLEERFHRTGFWELVEDKEISWINAAPAIIAILANTAPPPSPPRRVRFVRSASAPLPVAVLRRFEERTGIPVLESYGMTEAASMITANPVGSRREGSVGLPVGTDVRVVEDHRPVATGTLGRVEIRGAGVISSYAVGDDAGTFDVDGWLDTKDIGYFDPDGYLYLAGRADDVINRGGEKVYPREVEEVLLCHLAVTAAAVVGQPDEVLGARPVAYVVTSETVQDDEALSRELRAHCARELSSYKVPHEVRLVEALPVGPTGKVRRRELETTELTRTGS